MNKNYVIVTILLVLLQGCTLFESTFEKQIKVCIEDIKLGLGDPESLELLSTEEINLDGGGYRIDLKYTAKNALGGRVRGSSLCGFKTKSDVELDPKDILNEQRKLFRDLKELGINLK